VEREVVGADGRRLSVVTSRRVAVGAVGDEEAEAVRCSMWRDDNAHTRNPTHRHLSCSQVLQISPPAAGTEHRLSVGRRKERHQAVSRRGRGPRSGQATYPCDDGTAGPHVTRATLPAPKRKDFESAPIPVNRVLQPFSQKSRTPSVAKEFQIGLCGVVEADLELFCNCWSAGFLGERL